MVAAAMLMLATWSGCVPVATTAMQTHAPQATIGIWYSVEQAARASTSLEDALARDFGNLAMMGVDTVFVEHCDPRDTQAVVAAAAAHQLRLVLADPVAMRYVRTGWRHSGWFAPAPLVPQRSMVAARCVGRVIDEATLSRALELSRIAHGAVPPLALAAEIDTALADRVPTDAFDMIIWRTGERRAPETAHGGIAEVACVRTDAADQSDVRSWLAQYHANLATGFTDGVVFDSYRLPPGSPRGVVACGGPLPPERVAILRRIADRAQRWQNTLAGLGVHNTKAVPVRDVDVRVAVLANTRRQCLLLYNPSPVRFARGQITLNTSLAATTFERAVTVARAEDTTPGPVHQVHDGRLVVPVALAPGEAELFELF